MVVEPFNQQYLVGGLEPQPRRSSPKCCKKRFEEGARTTAQLSSSNLGDSAQGAASICSLETGQAADRQRLSSVTAPLLQAKGTVETFDII